MNQFIKQILVCVFVCVLYFSGRICLAEVNLDGVDDRLTTAMSAWEESQMSYPWPIQ